MANDRLSETKPEDLVRTLKDLQRGVERAWAEANLLSADVTARTSAREQLNGRLGDEHSAGVMRLSRQNRDIG
jgi:hypothetical protein